MSATRYAVAPLTQVTTELLSSAGMETAKAQSVARLLVLTDMLGRHTHGWRYARSTSNSSRRY